MTVLEKQISVDPISVTTYPVTTGPRMEVMSLPPNHHHLMPAKSANKFISSSLPGSASSSPCFDLAFTKHKKKYKIQAAGPLARQHSVALGNLERLRESHLRKSKSCGEGRACQPSLDFDMWSPSNKHRDNHTGEERREEVKRTLYSRQVESYEEKFKCGACLFLPGLGLSKGKTVRARKVAEPDTPTEDFTVSQRVSLEKFECGSWRSSAVINNEEDGSSNLFFDLPVELIRCNSSANDAETTGFMFDNHHRKGVLKSRKTQEPASNSSRHVRFSTSSPTASSSSSCVTPRLHKARDDFSAFLEAQSA